MVRGIAIIVLSIIHFTIGHLAFSQGTHSPTKSFKIARQEPEGGKVGDYPRSAHASRGASGHRQLL